jgi:hypothetical protein
MDLKIINTKGSLLDIPHYKSELNIYKKYNIIHIPNLFHSIIINKELYNLVIYNNSNFNDIINLLIKKKYYNINFDFNHLNLEIIAHLLEEGYNMPYIFTKSKINLPVLNLLYKPKLDIINIAYINYMLTQFGSGNKTVCNAFATFNNKTLNFLYNEIHTDNHGEISGKLEIIETFDEINKSVFEIMIIEGSFNNGDTHEVDSIESRYNFHTHPMQSYKTINTKLGWPSVDDYVVFIMAYLVDKDPTYFHWICAMEGIYVLTIPKDTIDLISLLKKDNKMEDKVEKYLYQHISIDKRSNKFIDTIKNGITVNSGIDYITCIDKSPLFEYKNKQIKLFDIQFFDWKGDLGLLGDNRMYFTFNYPKVNGNCLAKKEHLRK